MKRFFGLIICFLLLFNTNVLSKGITVSSPNGRITAVIDDEGQLSLSISLDGKMLVQPSPIGLTLADGTHIGMNGNVGFGKATNIDEQIDAPFYRQRQFRTVANQLDLRIKGGFGIVIRAYDEGVAYRFYTTRKGETIIQDEQADFRFGKDRKAWLSYTTNDDKPFAMAFQNIYHETTLDTARHKLAFLPVTVDCGAAKVTVLESDLRAYPGMFLQAEGDMLRASFASYPKKMAYYRWRGMSYVAETEDFIAQSKGKRDYPWRIFAITEHDTDMPTNNLVYALATPNQIGDTSWIKPGKVAWDWWNDWNLQGVDFVAGINMPTYKYYIDFAAKNGLEYIVLDEGWYDSNKGDIMQSIPDINLPELIAYGKQRGVDIVLWTVFNVLDEHLDEACAKYSGMGIKGFKVDFLDRNDQTAVEMAERIAATCAKYHLFLDYHGYFAPTGMSRTYPNILNYEGVFGMEEIRWCEAEKDMPRYQVTFPFIRMMAGNVDFTPGAMRNGTHHDWKAIYTKPISMGTRANQAACYVIHDSPFTMLCDSPTNYEKEPEYTQFIATIPTVWDETRVLQGEMGKYIVTVRRKGNDWYIAGQTNWDARELTLPLDFLGEGAFATTILTDGINANHDAEDYYFDRQVHGQGDKLTIKMASGGGFVIKFGKLSIVDHL
ncbi:MAG: glycoside hydrolase family 97 protein [Prevotella sp.]|nr:glycoside hydrolase family 97 protein [Prevotella sp.]MBQ6210644.1 glycoside hydrolase family 97 protein [Prevotella sp.]